jgi:hypothetical protein
MTASALDWLPILLTIQQLTPTLLPSAAATRGLSSLNPLPSRYGQTLSRSLTFRGGVRGYLRCLTPSTQQQSFRFRIVFFARRGVDMSLRLERTEDSPYLSWEEIMHRRCGSARGYVLSTDLGGPTSYHRM